MSRTRSNAFSGGISPLASQGRQRSNAISIHRPPDIVNIKFTGFGSRPVTFSSTEQNLLIEGTLNALECSKLAAAAAQQNFAGSEAAVLDWFGAGQTANAVIGTKKMHAILTDNRRTITFVDARGQTERLIGVVGTETCAGGRETRDKYGVVVTAPMTAGVYAYVKTCGGGGCEATAAHVGSGIKVYMGERFFHPSKNEAHRANTVYHELTHKVLATIDHAYGVEDCKNLAINDPVRAIVCGDCWSFFAQSFKYPV